MYTQLVTGYIHVHVLNTCTVNVCEAEKTLTDVQCSMLIHLYEVDKTLTRYYNYFYRVLIGEANTGI